MIVPSMQTRGCYFAPGTFERGFRVPIAAPMKRTEATVVAADFVSSNVGRRTERMLKRRKKKKGANRGIRFYFLTLLENKICS